MKGFVSKRGREKKYSMGELRMSGQEKPKPKIYF